MYCIVCNSKENDTKSTDEKSHSRSSSNTLDDDDNREEFAPCRSHKDPKLVIITNPFCSYHFRLKKADKQGGEDLSQIRRVYFFRLSVEDHV